MSDDFPAASLVDDHGMMRRPLFFLFAPPPLPTRSPPPPSPLRAGEAVASASHWAVAYRPNRYRCGPHAPYPRDAPVTLEGHRASQERLERWPEFKRTPLVSLPHVAKACGVAAVYAKVEGGRCGLGSFKALGGALAVELLAASLKERQPPPQPDDATRTTTTTATATPPAATVSTASAGNHGLAVAWGARRSGLRCVVFLHEGVGPAAAAGVEALGAEVRRVRGDYAASVQAGAAESRAQGWHVIQDVDGPNYEEVPRQIWQGYSTVAEEIVQQVAAEAEAEAAKAGAAPKKRAMSHVFVNAGVGGFAAAMCGHLWETLGVRRPRFVVVEPLAAPCVLRAAAAREVVGEGAKGPGEMEPEEQTVMTGLDCAEVAPLAWRLLSRGANDFVAISDECVAPSMRLLASGGGVGETGEHDTTPKPPPPPPPLVAGCSAVAGLGTLLAAAAQPALRDALDLTEESRVVVVLCEGATEPEKYKELVGASPEDVAGGDF